MLVGKLGKGTVLEKDRIKPPPCDGGAQETVWYKKLPEGVVHAPFSLIDNPKFCKSDNSALGIIFKVVQLRFGEESDNTYTKIRVELTPTHLSGL